MSNRKGYTDLDRVEPIRYDVTLSCGHTRLIEKPLPSLGDRMPCGSCGDSLVVVVDEREYVVRCPDCRRPVIERMHVRRSISAATRATVHNVRERRGHHAVAAIEGTVLEA